MQSALTPPPAPNPRKVSQEQFATNLGTASGAAAIGNANVQGPAGSTQYNVTGSQSITGPGGQTYEVPTYTQTNTLSPENQQIYSGLQGLQQQQLGTVGNALGQPYGADAMSPVNTDFSDWRGRVEDALFDRLNPQLDRSYNQLYDRLINQGHSPGNEAYNASMDEWNRMANDMRLGVTARGLQEMQGLFGMEQANRQRELQEMTTLRNQPINELNALTGGANMMLPNYGGYNAPQLANTDTSQNYYNSAALNQANYNAQLQAQNAAMGGLFGLGSAGLFGLAYKSDRRLKRAIRDLGVRLLNGVKLYAYRYLWDDVPRVGVMADELADVRPDAVVMGSDGYLVVNYGKL